MKPINLKEKHSLFTEQWHPHQIAVVDDMQVILAKIQGEFVWHAHENENELFDVLRTETWVNKTKEKGSEIIFVVDEELSHYQACTYIELLKDAGEWLQNKWKEQ